MGRTIRPCVATLPAESEAYLHIWKDGLTKVAERMYAGGLRVSRLTVKAVEDAQAYAVVVCRQNGRRRDL